MNSYEPERINVEELDSVAEGFNKTNRNNFNLKIFLNEWINIIGEKLKNLGELIQALTKEVEKKANKTDIPTIPTSLPANGGNSNTLGGISPGYHPTNSYIPVVTGPVMDVGKYIDFHEPGSNKDFDARLFFSNKNPYWVIDNGVERRIPLSDGTMQENLNAEMLNGKRADTFAKKGYGSGGEVGCMIPRGADILSITDANGQYINGVFMGEGLINSPDPYGYWYFIKQIVHNNDWVNLQILSFTDPNAKWKENRKISGKWQGWKEM